MLIHLPRCPLLWQDAYEKLHLERSLPMKTDVIPLYVNMSETRASTKFNVKGEKGFGDEHVERFGGCRRDFLGFRGRGEGDASRTIPLFRLAIQ